VDFEMRFLPAFQYAKELIDEDYLGQFLRVDVTMTMEQAWGEHGNWAADDARGGGVLMEVGAHFLDALLWWFGDVRAGIADRRTLFSTLPQLSSVGRGEQADDSFWCTLEFARGGQGVLSFVTGARHDPGWTITAIGSVGTLVIKSGELWGRRDGDLHMAPLAIPQRLEQKEKPNDPLLWGMVRLFERVAVQIQSGAALPFPTFRDGVAVAQVIDAIKRASDEQQWIRVE
jgi:predicted dehydrogenase